MCWGPHACGKLGSGVQWGTGCDAQVSRGGAPQAGQEPVCWEPYCPQASGRWGKGSCWRFLWEWEGGGSGRADCWAGSWGFPTETPAPCLLAWVSGLLFLRAYPLSVCVTGSPRPEELGPARPSGGGGGPGLGLH